MCHLLQPLSAKLRHSFLLRWVLANVVGWVAALHLLGRAAVSDNFVIVAVGLAGVLIIGLAQWWVLGEHLTIGLWWVIGTAIAILVSAFLNYIITSLILYERGIDRTLQYLIGGGTVGLLMAFSQWLILRRYFGRLVFWITANTLGGALCAAISLPLTLSRSLAGAAILGLLTGYALIAMGRANQPENHYKPIDEYAD